MARDNQAIQDDIAYMRSLAHEGRHAPLLAGPILVTAGAPQVPKTLIDQLTVGGRLVIPVGSRHSQALLKVTRLSKDPGELEQKDLGGCRFVDLIGEYGWGN